MYADDQLKGTRNNLFKPILDQLDKKQSNPMLLDVGAGCGGFLSFARDRGWRVKGIDPSIESVSAARNLYNLDIFCGTLQAYDGHEKYDAVTFINVLDHVSQPWADIKRARQMLKKEGLIYIRVPNGLMHSGIMRFAEIIGIDKATYKLLAIHEYSFTPGFLMKLMSQSGFCDIEVRNAPPSMGFTNAEISNILSNLTKILIYQASRMVHTIIRKNFVVGPSLELIGYKAG